jgi:hypothetical protein
MPVKVTLENCRTEGEGLDGKVKLVRRGDQEHRVHLQSSLPPSRRNPQGAPRCQGVTWRDEQPRQCKRKARRGFRVCSHHGAGSQRRERAGVAKNPAFSRLTTGERAKPATLEQLCQEKPEVRPFYEENWNRNDVFDLRPVLARAKAITESLVSIADSGHGAEQEARFLMAIGALAHLLRTAKDMLHIEEQAGPVTPAHMARVINGILSTVKERVPEDGRLEALAFLHREALGEELDLRLTDDELRSWSDGMLQAYKDGASVGLVRLMAGPQRLRQYSGAPEFEFANDTTLEFVATGENGMPLPRQQRPAEGQSL